LRRDLGERGWVLLHFGQQAFGLGLRLARDRAAEAPASAATRMWLARRSSVEV